jgi:RNA polymerase sigma-70 factor (ECF subfamily)
MEQKFKFYSDEELLTLMTNKESSSLTKEQSFAEIYNRHSGKVHAYVLKIVGDEDDAEDLFQDVFIRFYRRAANGRHSNVIGFLITIARNLCLNYKRDRKKTVLLEDYEYLAYDTQNYEDKELLDLINRSLELLESDYKEAFVLREYTGLNYDEISEIMDITPVNARSKVFRAKKKLKEILKPYLNDISKI